MQHHDTDGDATRVNPLQAATGHRDVPGRTESAAIPDPDAEPTVALDPVLMPIPSTAAVIEPTGDPDLGAATGSGEDQLDRRHRDWAWVEQWREEEEAPSWAPGITLAVFVAGLVAVAIIVLTNGLSDTAWLALVINLVIAAGMAPALWLSRDLPVFRFLAGGAAVGLALGWVWILLAPSPATEAATPPAMVLTTDEPDTGVSGAG